MSFPFLNDFVFLYKRKMIAFGMIKQSPNFINRFIKGLTLQNDAT